MGWNPRIGQRVRIWSPGAKLAVHAMAGRITGTWRWTRGTVRPFRVYNVRLDLPNGGVRSISVTREALSLIPARMPARQRTRK